MRGRMSGVARTANEGRRHVGPTFLAYTREMGETPRSVKRRKPLRSLGPSRVGRAPARSLRETERPAQCCAGRCTTTSLTLNDSFQSPS